MKEISSKVWNQVCHLGKKYGIPKNASYSITRQTNGNHFGIVDLDVENSTVKHRQYVFGFEQEKLVCIEKIEWWVDGNKSGETREWLLGNEYPETSPTDRYEVGTCGCKR
jgi:hypothetical protein